MNSGYYFKETFKSIFKNRWLSLASIGVVMVSLYILGAFLLLIVNANYLADSVESDLEITVYIKDGVSLSQSSTLGAAIQEIDSVEQLSFVSKEEALASLKDQFADSDYALSAIQENNPLPDTFHVTLKDAGGIQSVSSAIEKMEGVDAVQYGQGIVEKILAITDGARLAGSILVIALTIAAIFLIATTTRLSVYARQTEIEIMKYIGATNWFVRWPFILEGMILGLFGSLLSSVALYYSYKFVVNYFRNSLAFMNLVNDWNIMLIIFAGLLTIGFVIGIIGSFISVRKFLKV